MKLNLKTSLLTTPLLLAAHMALSQTDVRIEAGPNDFLWTFENAVGNVATSLYNNGNPQTLAANGTSGYLTNDPGVAKFGNVSLYKQGATGWDKPSLAKSFSQMTILFWINMQQDAANSFLQRTSDATGAQGSMLLQYNAGRQFSFSFATTNGTSGNYFGFFAPSGTWSQVALTFDGGMLSWFSNGVPVLTTNMTIANAASSFIPQAIINSALDTRWVFDVSGRTHYVDDFAIYSQILTTNQLQYIIANGLQAFNVPEPHSLALVTAASAIGLMLRRRR